MTADASKPGRARSVGGTVGQVIVGAILGIAAAVIAWRILPMQSGLGVFVTSVVISVVVTAVVAFRFRSLRPGAYAFATTSILLDILVAVVVVSF